jgi:hypothetical protein
MTRPNSAIVRADLTTYAFGLSQDLDKIRRVIELLSPTVPTGGTSGLYNVFEDTQAFKAYATSLARRSIGGQAAKIEFLGSTANYNANPSGLRISIDEFERKQAGNNSALLDQAKTRTLTVNCLLSHLNAIITTVKAAVAATANKGKWNEANVDPVAELNELIKAVYKASGMVPNIIAMDFGAWCVLASNPKILARMPGADIAAVNPMRLQAMLVNPNVNITVVDTAVLTGGGLGNASATVQGIMGGSVLAFFNSPTATVYDPSFCKTFAPSASLFTEVYGYREEPHLDWLENDWNSDVQIVSSKLCKRIDVTGAND